FTITGIHSPFRPLLLEQLQQSEDPQSHPQKQETEMSGNSVQSFANHASYPIKNSQGQNFTIPVQSVNFSFKPSATSDIVGGNSKKQHALNKGVEVIPSQAFAVSFASFNGTSLPSNLNFSSMKQNPLKQHGMQQQQPATAIRNKASSTNTSSATKFANNGPVFSQTHTQFKSSNQTSHSKITGRTFTITGIHSPFRPLLLEQLQQSEDPQSHPYKQETEVSGNNVQSFANHASYPIKNSQGQNFTIPVQSVNFSFKPSATSDIVDGNSKKQLALNGGVEVIPSQAFAVSFASFNGTSLPSNLNLSSTKQNPLVIQSLPDVARQGYQAASTPQTVQQKTYSITVKKRGGNSSHQDDKKNHSYNNSSSQQSS
ncbi:hypothetical protein RYX36_022505, partial [Vicia faba]